MHLIPLYRDAPICFVGGRAHSRVLLSIWQLTLVVAVGFLEPAAYLLLQVATCTDDTDADVSQELTL